MRAHYASLILYCLPAIAADRIDPAVRPGPYLFVLDLQGTPLDEFPAGVKALNGVMTVVDKDGQHMLKASSPSEFLITLPQILPADFTVELDFIPKTCCAPDDIMLEGTPTMNRGVASVQLTWQPERISAVGGGGEMYQSAMPADLAASTPGNMTHVVVVFQGTTIKLYTNGRRLYTLEKQFARGRVLRVWLGGGDDRNALYLAGLRIGDGAMAPVIANAPASSTEPSALGKSGLPVVTPTPPPAPAPPPEPAPTGGPTNAGQQEVAQNKSGLTANPIGASVQGLFGRMDLQGNTSLSWQPVPGATSYVVVRWLDEDPQCCPVMSPPAGMASVQWQAPQVSRMGTYRYRVYAYAPGGIATGETTVQYPPPLQLYSVLNVAAVPLGVTLLWGPLPGATAYRVYRAPSLKEPGVLLGTVSSSAPSLPGNEGLTVALDAELVGDPSQYQYWIQALMGDGTLSDPGPIAPITQKNSSSASTFGGPMVPPGLSASVGGSTTINYLGQDVRGSKVTWTWDQDLTQRPIYLYFTTVEISSNPSIFGSPWALYRSDAIQVPGTPPIQYLKQGDAMGPPYTVGIPAGLAVRFCVSFFPTTTEQRADPNMPGCVMSQTLP